MKNIIEEIKKEISNIIIGQDKIIENLLIAFFSNGHILLESVPGLGKTTIINVLSKCLNLKFKRIQFTPDLLPSDIIGLEMFNSKKNSFEIIKGPIFTNILLIDEINRAPAKIQSALLESMQEKQVTIGGNSFKIDLPFFVMATQNPIEEGGSYLLPEAELDRFMMKIILTYTSKENEIKILNSNYTNNDFNNIKQILDIESLFKIQKEIEDIYVDKEVEKYIIDIISATRNPENYDLANLSKYINYGASPRASIDLYKASKTTAYFKNLEYVSPIEVAYIVHNVLRHRIILNYDAELDQITTDKIIDIILEKIPVL